MCLIQEAKTDAIQPAAIQEGTADGVSSSSDASTSGLRQGLVTNEAEAIRSCEDKTAKGITEKMDNAPSGSSDDHSTVDLPSNDSRIAEASVDSSTECVKKHSNIKPNDESDNATSSTMTRPIEGEESSSCGTLNRAEETKLVTKGKVDNTLITKESSPAAENKAQVVTKDDHSEAAQPSSVQTSQNDTTNDGKTDTETGESSSGELTGPDQGQTSGSAPVVKKKRRRSSIGTYLLRKY